jgi:undecaprenyl-diphosphatase
MSHLIELNFIQWLHQFRTPTLDACITAFDFFDRPEFYLILTPAIWLGIHWKAGYRLFCILCLNSLTNYTLKAIFLLPRPFHVDPQVGIIHVNGYGFPSGAAQSVVLLSGLLIAYWKSPWKWPVICFYAFCVSFSRVYLGLHFPTDIIGGWVVGFLLLLLFIYGRPRIETFLETKKLTTLFAISQIIPLLIMLALQGSRPTLKLCPTALGMGLGIYLMHRYRLIPALPRNTLERVKRMVLGIACAFLCYKVIRLFGNDASVTFIQNYLIGLCVSLSGCLFSLRSYTKTSIG